MENGTGFIEELEEYTKLLEEIISEFTGFNITLPLEFSIKPLNDIGDIINMGMHIQSDVNYLYLEKFGHMLIEQISNILFEYINREEELDWEIFNHLKEKFSMSFIFGNIEDKKLQSRQKIFVNDLISLGNKTYESTPADIGVIYCEKKVAEELIERYDCEIIWLDKQLNIKSFFENEKPFLRIINGESLNIMVNNEFLVYGILRSINDCENFAKRIIGEHSSDNLNRNTMAVIQWMKETLDIVYPKLQSALLDSKAIDVDEKRAKIISSTYVDIIKKGLIKATPKVEYQSCFPEIIYFKMNSKQLSVYSGQDFIVSYNKNVWKLKNYNLLQYVILQYVILKECIYFSIEEISEESEILMRGVEGTKRLTELFLNLSNSNTSSIIVFYSESFFSSQINYELTEKEVEELLLNAPFIKRDSSKIYLKAIKKDKKHLNLLNVSDRFLESLCAVDGAVVLDETFNILSYGEIIDVSSESVLGSTFGTGTSACEVASKNGLAIKISEDGDIRVYLSGKNVLNL